MSTLPGLASKGEKPKAKFQSLDINKIYRVSRGENSEKQQQKNTTTYKHGMQFLGKVPNTRRAPANLPSLKSEHSGNDTAVPLVPPGGPGWGKQDSTSSTTSNTSPVTTTPPISNPVPIPTPQISSHQAAIALPVTTTIPPPNKPQQQQPHITPIATPASTDKSWSAVMSGIDPLHHPPPYQSPQFQHEFPSLSCGDGGIIRTGSEVPYTPGLSLRPQTEGSWIQGGSRPGMEGAGRPNSGQLGAPPQLSAQVGLAQQQQQSLPPQYRGVMPPFMCKGNMATNGTTGNLNSNSPAIMNGRNRVDNRAPRIVDGEEVAQRPIIKEEELSGMDEIERDMGWAYQDDIDYNQKLAFSDDELLGEKHLKKDRSIIHKEIDKPDGQTNDAQPRNWNNARPPPPRGRSSEEDEIRIRRNQHSKEVELAVLRAKQRKEEEEKRFNEATKQGAKQKLKELEEKINKRDRDHDEGTGTINPSVVPPKPITPAEIPLPDFQKEKEVDRDSRARTPIEPEEKVCAQPVNTFRQMTQIEGKNVRKPVKISERDPRERDIREQNGPSFSRQFQSNLPPRFKRQQNNNSNVQSPIPIPEMCDNRWPSQNLSKNGSNNFRNVRQGSPEREFEDDRREYKRQSSDESYRSAHRSEVPPKPDIRYTDENLEFRHQAYDYGRGDRDEDKSQKERMDKKDSEQIRINNDESHLDRRDKYRDDRYERPQRPDSRDSRASRESRHSRESMRESDPREFSNSWADSKFEMPAYEEKRRDYPIREDRRQVPGPITKERIEADDMRNEKRNLTQLKRGQMPDKKIGDQKTEEQISEKLLEDKKNSLDILSEPKAWADTTLPLSIVKETPQYVDKTVNPETKLVDLDSKKSEKMDEYKDKDDKRNGSARNRIYPQNKNWNSEYHRSGWPKRPPNKGSRPNMSQRPSSSVSGDFHGTDSEGSLDEISADTISKDSSRSPKPMKKFDKDDKNRNYKQDKDRKNDKHQESKKDNYVPRGEPSRHGRGGGNFRSRGGLSKRIDGYGPPPSKSPFGHHEDKDRKHSSMDMSTDNAGTDDKTKLNQQALSASIIGSFRKDFSALNVDKKFDDKDKSKKPLNIDNRKSKPKSEGHRDEQCDSNSDNSDDKDGKNMRRSGKPNAGHRGGSNMTQLRRSNQPPRLGPEKRNYGVNRHENSITRQNSNGTLRSHSGPLKKDKIEEQNVLCNAIADISLKNKDELEQVEDSEEKISLHGDSDGFQEVKSKKTGKERQKSIDEKIPPKSVPAKTEKDRPVKKVPNVQLTQQQIQNIPPLMATLVNPPPNLTQTNKTQFERPRQNKIPPRFAKLRENVRLQKMQQQGICDVNDMNKVNQSMNVYNVKETPTVVAPLSNAWDKPLGSQLRTIETDMLGVTIDNCKPLDHVPSPSQSSSPNDKIMAKPNLIQDKAILDGTTPPVNTIIFENTNFKSAPGPRTAKNDKPRKLEEGTLENPVVSGFNKPIGDVLKNDKSSEPIQMSLSFKVDNGDMKLDFFDSELSHLTEDKSTKILCTPRSIHAISTANSTVSTADALNFKIQSVKKVWETPSDHNVGQDDGNNSFSSSFAPDSNSLDPNSYVKANDPPDDNHDGGYSTSSNQPSNNTTNVCKVKPTQQVSGTSGPAVLSSATHQPHSGMVGPGLMGNPLSPPPMQPVIGAGVALGQPPQQYTANQHLGYQSGLGSSTQYGISTIPSPPTVLPYSTQQLQAQTAGLYGAFQIDQTGVLGGQGRSQYSQYPNHYGLGQTGSSPYSAQSMYLQTAQPHPPPSAQAPELYQNLNNYRLSTAQFGQNQQLNNPTTVLISSTSNSLMSASVKPSTQQISAIGTKAGGVGQAYQQQSQQGQQMYMAFDPSMQANYLQGAGVMQRPTGPVQNNVVPTIQPSSSYYSGSTGGQTGYFQQPGNSSIQQAPLQQHQAGYGLQGNVFGSHNQSHNNAGLQSFNSHFLSAANPLQLAAALTAQQFRSASTQYMKNVSNASLGDQTNRPQQLKSPGSQEVLSSVFNTGSQIPSPKSRQNCKQPPPQPSPTTQHKYNLYQSVGNQSANVQRYPTPIQRPVNYQNVGSVQNIPPGNQKHRSNPNNKPPTRQYYTNQSNQLPSQNEKSDDGKMNETVSLSTHSNNVSATGIVNKVSIGANSSNSVTGDIVKDTKEEAPSLKD